MCIRDRSGVGAPAAGFSKHKTANQLGKHTPRAAHRHRVGVELVVWRIPMKVVKTFLLGGPGTPPKMKKTKKLLVLKVDLGQEQRTIVSGIAESYTTEEVVGKKVTVLTNLQPRAIRGVKSQGMLLMAEDGDGRLIFISPEDENTPSGLRIQ